MYFLTVTMSMQLTVSVYFCKSWLSKKFSNGVFKTVLQLRESSLRPNLYCLCLIPACTALRGKNKATNRGDLSQQGGRGGGSVCMFKVGINMCNRMKSGSSLAACVAIVGGG